jgi:pimeloyl-ACP methyl ester carboxylesterase
MPYEDVAEPSDVTEAFLRSDSAAAQAQAAALLAIGWQLSGDPATDLAADVFEYVGLRPLGPSRTIERVPPEAVRGFLASSSEQDASAREIRSRLFSEYRREPTPLLAAALFESCLDSDDDLVRVSAAAGYWEVGLEGERLQAILADGAEIQDELVREVARTVLARVSPEFPLRPELGLDDLDEPRPMNSTLLVHGTFARRSSWWRPGGDFHTYILQEVRSDLYSQADAFYWSGDYSDAARLLGAEDLVAWLQARGSGAVDLITHSHGGNLAMLASYAPLSIGKLVLLSCPVHWAKYSPHFASVGDTISIRTHCDLVILADRGGQRFHDSRIREHVLPLWFKHGASHDPDVWRRFDVPAFL